MYWQECASRIKSINIIEWNLIIMDKSRRADFIGISKRIWENYHFVYIIQARKQANADGENDLEENNGRVGVGGVPALAKSRKEQNGGPRAPLEFWLYITHLMKQKRLQLSSACVRVGRHSSLSTDSTPTLSLSTLLM